MAIPNVATLTSSRRLRIDNVPGGRDRRLGDSDQFIANT
jgi:hypothetical protein